jgi:hypothetical protein
MSRSGAQAGTLTSGIVEDAKPQPIPGASMHATCGYQSEDAAHAAAPKKEEIDTQVHSAVVADPNETRVLPAVDQSEDASRMVKVRTRQHIPLFRFGPQSYQLEPNKEYLVPLFVKRHLEEKGLL